MLLSIAAAGAHGYHGAPKSLAAVAVSRCSAMCELLTHHAPPNSGPVASSYCPFRPTNT